MKLHVPAHITNQSPFHLRINASAKKVAILLMILLLSGCSSAKDTILHYSGIMSEEDYEKYIELKDSGQLGQDGRYALLEPDASPQFSPPVGSIHVTFAKNAYINVEYYLDSTLKTKVDQSRCYLMPGDHIYYAPESLICEHPSSQWYEFDCFYIYTYDNSGNRSDKPFGTGGGGNTQIVCQVPEDCGSTEISIVPMGKYVPRSIELVDYYTDSAGQAQELAGTWIVNDKTVASRTIEVSPVDPLYVDFTYDPTKYSFVASNPSSFYHENGSVRFETTAASENVSRYSVELRSLDGTYLFDPSQYPVEHGTISFEYLGRNITDKCYIPDGGAIRYTATPHPGYRHAKTTGQVIVNVSKPDETNERLKEATKFYSDEQVEVILPRPVGGTIEYTAEGKILFGNKCKLPCGTVISLKFAPWNGWISSLMDGVEYTVTEQAVGQTISLAGTDINSDLFREADSHKPTLNVVLTDSAKDATFSVSSSNSQPQGNLSYETGNKNSIIPDWLGQNDRLIFSDKVGTDQGITLAVTNDTILNGYALKLNVDTTDTKGNKSHSIRYITKLPVEETITLYGQQEIAGSSTVYETVTITVSKVEVVDYATTTIGHADVTVSLNDITVPYVLKAGDVLEPSREVRITIIPENGYYITGSKDSRGIYSETMKYSKWEQDHQKTLDKHSIQKIWYVTLDTSDAYGSCVYKLDGISVSGRIGIRQGQKLTLDYTLTDSNYKIIREGPGGFLGGIIHSDTESFNIPVSEALDDHTIRRSDYIAVKRKER